MRAVLDTNVLVSALIKGGKPRRLLRALFRPGRAVILSEEIVEEFSRVTTDDKIRKYVDDEDVSMFLGAVLSRAAFVRLAPNVKVFNNADDIILGTAIGGDANLIVTGDKHILELKKFKGIKIVSVEKALSMLGKR